MRNRTGPSAAIPMCSQTAGQTPRPSWPREFLQMTIMFELLHIKSVLTHHDNVRIVVFRTSIYAWYRDRHSKLVGRAKLNERAPSTIYRDERFRLTWCLFHLSTHPLNQRERERECVCVCVSKASAYQRGWPLGECHDAPSTQSRRLERL